MGYENTNLNRVSLPWPLRCWPKIWCAIFLALRWWKKKIHADFVGFFCWMFYKVAPVLGINFNFSDGRYNSIPSQIKFHVQSKKTCCSKMLQYLQMSWSYNWRDTSRFSETPRRLLQASRTWTLCDGYVDFLRRLCDGDICGCKLFHCWEFRKFHLKFPRKLEWLLVGGKYVFLIENGDFPMSWKFSGVNSSQLLMLCSFCLRNVAVSNLHRLFKHLWHQKVTRSLSVCELEKHHQVLCWMGGAWGGPKFLKASGMQHTMPGAKIPNKGWW